MASWYVHLFPLGSFEKNKLLSVTRDYFNSAKFRFELGRENAATGKLYYSLYYFNKSFELISLFRIQVRRMAPCEPH